jgi:hypothetical protein
VVVEFELPGPLVVVVVAVDWDPVSFPNGELLLLLKVLSIESNVFSMSLFTALFMEPVRLGVPATCTIHKNMGNKIKPNFLT